MSAHTSGPWKATVGACYDQVEVENGPLICFAAIREESKANACLIAAAPDLLEACKRLLVCMSLANWENDDAAICARAAIARATPPDGARNG